MAGSSNPTQIPSSPDVTPKEEPITIDRPESPNPFQPADQTAKTLDDSKIWVSTPTGGIRGYIVIITFRNALRVHYLPHSMEVDYAKVIWEDIIHRLNKKTREKVIPYPSVLNWALKPNQHEGPPFTDHMKAICNIDVHVDSQAPTTSSQTEKIEASISKPSQSDKETQSSSAKHKSPNHPLPSTPVVGEMHKEAHQVAGGLTSLRATSEEGAHPQLSSEFLDFPSQESSVQKKLKTLDSLPSLLNKVTDTLNRKMIPEPGDANRDINITETCHLQTDDELSDKELKQIEADDQAIQTILLGLPEDIYTVYNQKEVDELKAEQLAKIQDPLALIANSNNPYAFSAPHQDQS
nr:hypothetical protein [Tanacetum cinerariifolium]